MNRIEIWDSFVSLFILPFFSVLPERGDMEKTIGMRIRECRLKMGMTQEKLAELLYIKKATVSAYENDRFDMKVSVLKDIAKVLKTTVAYLVEGETEGNPHQNSPFLANPPLRRWSLLSRSSQAWSERFTPGLSKSLLAEKPIPHRKTEETEHQEANKSQTSGLLTCMAPAEAVGPL